ncbi:hypothetical protein M0802_009463 [Mischocyttarus mexicanus]|nr:hypothetical protein M0802_009463 [Mischocyttarus mexicanus]
MVVSPVGGRVPPNRGVLHNGLNLNGTRRDLEALEVAAYLTKLKSLVPDMPRKRKLSKLEVIQRGSFGPPGFRPSPPLHKHQQHHHQHHYPRRIPSFCSSSELEQNTEGYTLTMRRGRTRNRTKSKPLRPVQSLSSRKPVNTCT